MLGIACFRSNVCKSNLDPEWDEENFSLSVLCDGDLDRAIKISVFDHEGDGDHDHMGSIETTVNVLISAKRAGAHDFSHAFALGKKHKDKNLIVVDQASVSGIQASDKLSTYMESLSVDSPNFPKVHSPIAPKIPTAHSSSLAPMVRGGATFVDYIGGGCELNMCVAIDFTGSNGDPRKPGTLHHISSNGDKNDYEKAISALGSLLANYDSDQKYPVWGFGAKYEGVVHHAFQCGTSPQCSGVDGVLQAYRHVFQTGLIMSRPTDFTEVIQVASAFAQSDLDAAQVKGKQSYTVLLIFSDGSVSDVVKTGAILDQVSNSPLSIVIVGIGDDGFSEMKFLDDRTGAGPYRDIVHFVEFNSYKHSKEAFTSATLSELPNQLVNFFQSREMSPLPRTAIDLSQVTVDDEDEEEIDLSLDFGSEEEIVVSGGYMQNGF